MVSSISLMLDRSRRCRSWSTEACVIGIPYYRARYYDPQTGRFVSEDPLRFDGSSADFYRYAANDPVSFADPTGLTDYEGFSPENLASIKMAVESAINTLTRSNCAGCDGKQVAEYLRKATIIYSPILADTQGTYCGSVGMPGSSASLDWMFNRIRISGDAFNFAKCSFLSSTVAHEATHLRWVRNSEADAREIEKKCFGVVTQ